MITGRLMRNKVPLVVTVVCLVVILHIFYTTSSPQRISNDPEPATHDIGDGSVPDSVVVDPFDGNMDLEEEQPAKKPAPEPETPKPVDVDNEKIVKAIHDFSIFFDDLNDYKPNSPGFKKTYKKEKAAEKFAGTDDFLFGKEYLENVLDIPDSTVADLKDSHTRFVDQQINKFVENYGVATFGNVLKSDPEWSTYEGSKGYVLIGGGQYSWLSYLVIKQIRATGSTLPIELFIPTTNDFEADFCQKLLPRYNARCNIFDNKLAMTLKEKYSIGGYQYKMLALLTSKFENVIYLDSDDFPVRNPEYILESDLYKRTGLIIWPDAWARTTNPKFYDIAGVTVKENKLDYNNFDRKQAEKSGAEVKPKSEYTFKDAWYHTFEGTLPDPTSEAGQLVVNKTKHLKTLLLAMYYNVFGPEYYYPLMTQGSAGEGDKETFIAAAHVLGEPWFQTKRIFSWVGYVSQVDNKHKSKALGHFDPVKSETTTEGLDYIFMHLSYPKYYPNWLVDNHDLIYAESGDHIRMYSPIYDNAGYDFDLRVLQFFTQGMCSSYYDESGNAIDEQNIKSSDEYMGKYLSYVRGMEKKSVDWCQKVFLPHLKWLKETTKFPDSVVQPKQKAD